MRVVPPYDPLSPGAEPRETRDVIYRSVCGLDVHQKTVVACRRRVLSGGRVDKEVQMFATTTAA